MTREDVIRGIVERETAKRPVEESSIQAELPDLHAAACAHFGTWETAMRYAGVHAPRLKIKHSKRPVLRRLRRLCSSGECLASEAVRYRHRLLYTAARELFGTWREALLAAEINPRNVTLWSKRQFTDKQQIMEALRWEFSQGTSTKWSAACRANQALALAAKGAFSTWGRALAAVQGASSETTNAPRLSWNEARVLAQIQLRLESCQPLNYRALRREFPSLLTTGQRYFGNWSAALAAAGLPVSKSTPRE